MIHFDKYYRLRLFLKRHATFLMVLNLILSFSFLFQYIKFGEDIPETFDGIFIVKFLLGLFYYFFGFLTAFKASYLFFLIRKAEFNHDFKFKNEDFYLRIANNINHNLKITVLLSVNYYFIQYFLLINN